MTQEQLGEAKRIVRQIDSYEENLKLAESLKYPNVVDKENLLVYTKTGSSVMVPRSLFCVINNLVLGMAVKSVGLKMNLNPNQLNRENQTS